MAKRFAELGFKSTLGMHDFIYEWDKTNVTSEKVIELIDKLQGSLKGTNIGLHFVTD